MLVNFVLTVGMFGGQLLVPVFLQSYRGLGAAETGLITMTQALAMLPMMPLVGRLADRFGTRTILLVGLPLVALSMWQFNGLSIDTSDGQLRLWLAARGVTMGLVMMPAMTAALNTVPTELTSRGSSLTNVMRQVFGSFGTAMFVTLLQARQTFHASVLAQGATSSNYTLQQTLGQVQQWVLLHGGSAAQAQADGLLLVVRQLQLTAAVQSFDDVFMVAALITLLALLPAVFIGDGKAGRSGHAEASLVME
jgi:MFS family permease